MAGLACSEATHQNRVVISLLDNEFSVSVRLTHLSKRRRW